MVLNIIQTTRKRILINYMIRLIIVVLLLLIFAVFSLIALPILWLIGKKNPVVKEKASNAVARFMFRLILFVCGTKTTAIGVENIPTDKPVLFLYLYKDKSGLCCQKGDGKSTYTSCMDA